MTAEKQEYENLIEPDIKLLKTLLDETGSNKIGDPIKREAIKRKYLSLTYNPTLIEKTMTPKQLFNMGHPLWEKPYTINEIEYILRNMHTCTCYEELEDMIRSYSEMIKYLHNQTDFDSLYPDSITNLMKGT